MNTRLSPRSMCAVAALLAAVVVLFAWGIGAGEDAIYDGPRFDVVLATDTCVNPEIALDGVLWETNDRIPKDWSDAQAPGALQTDGGDRARFTSSDGVFSLKYRAVTSNGGFSNRICRL